MMILIFLCIHLIFLIFYAIQIETRHSNLSYTHLLFALFFPFVGEVCLICADMTKPDLEAYTENAFSKIMPQHNAISEDAELMQVICTASGIEARKALSFLMQENPENLISLLKKALKANDTDVVHLSAAALMKLQRNYENKIHNLELQYAEVPGNQSFLRAYVEAIEIYIDSDLPDESYKKILLEQQSRIRINASKKVIENQWEYAFHE